MFGLREAVTLELSADCRHSDQDRLTLVVVIRTNKWTYKQATKTKALQNNVLQGFGLCPHRDSNPEQKGKE